MLARLALCLRILRARRFALFLPIYPTMHLAVGGTVPPHAWEAIVHYAIRQHVAAVDAAEARLLAELAAESHRQEALDAERAQVAAGTRTTRKAAQLLAEARQLTKQP